MLRISCLSRVFAPTPLRIGRKHGAFGRGSKLHKFSTSKGRDEDEDDEDDDDDDEHGYHEEDFDDMDFDEEDDDDDDDEFADMEWMEQGNAQFLSAADRKVEEHVKQKVRVQRAKHSKRRFVDRIRIKATGGHGGNGCSSFFSESAMRKRPNGGHGGAGGNVVIEADDRIQNLANATHHFKGGAGLNGMPNDSAGRRGKHCSVKVPCGTLVKRVKRFERELENGEFEIVDKMETVCDLDQPGATFLAAIGGKPGLGNRILAGKTTNFGRLRKHMPDSKGTGSPGTSQYYELELKTIADVGLVGYPNAGKSTLLSTLSRATPEIAPYPFTTLHPYVGIVEFPDTYRLSVADIPGLIEGAHRNVGLGHDFLRHIERTKILMYVLDTAGTEGRDPISDFKHLQRELELYAPDITTRPSLIIANKMDEQGERFVHVLLSMEAAADVVGYNRAGRCVQSHCRSGEEPTQTASDHGLGGAPSECAAQDGHRLGRADVALDDGELRETHQVVLEKSRSQYISFPSKARRFSAAPARREREMHRYETLEQLGNGSFGEVVKARSLKTNEVVAIKKMKALFPTWEECLQLRELKSLRVLRHENIVQLKEVIRDKEELYFVFEYMQSSLCKVMRQTQHHAPYSHAQNDDAPSGAPASSSPSWLSEAQIRSIMYQLFCGLAHMHKHGFFHRDIKPENLLCHDETLKIADLGQAREIRSRPPYTDYVATRWYRSPELLLRSTTYNSPIDLWACGCIMAELFLQAPLFPGSSEADQMCRICKVLGTPTKESWSEGLTMVSQMQFKFPKCASVSWKYVLPPGTSNTALQLIQELLQYDPSRRLTAAQALQHRFFDQHPVTRPMLTTMPPTGAVGAAEAGATQLPLKAEYKSSSYGGGTSYGGGGGGNCKKGGDDAVLAPDCSGRWSRKELLASGVSTENLGSSRKHSPGYEVASGSSSSSGSASWQAKQTMEKLLSNSPRDHRESDQAITSAADAKTSRDRSSMKTKKDSTVKSMGEGYCSARKFIPSPEENDESDVHEDRHDERAHTPTDHRRHHRPMRKKSADHLLQDLLDEFIA